MYKRQVLPSLYLPLDIPEDMRTARLTSSEKHRIVERVSQVAARLGVLKPAPFVFTVAGTNGKGTTCRTLESILMAAGYKMCIRDSYVSLYLKSSQVCLAARLWHTCPVNSRLIQVTQT